ncbi:hypothetical protein Mjas_03940 [Methanothermococcus sp. Ax23]|uniref:hypothetical protein n=1 Tax=Methanothermococcus sp. Ax23 TaxID=3156486 RepID=UPI003B9EE96A
MGSIESIEFIINKKCLNGDDIINLVNILKTLEIRPNELRYGYNRDKCKDIFYYNCESTDYNDYLATLEEVSNTIAKDCGGMLGPFWFYNEEADTEHGFDLLISKNSFELTFFYTLSRRPKTFINKLINIIKNLYLKTKPLIVQYYDGEELEDEYISTYEQLIKDGNPNIITGLTILSPEIVKNIGREKILSAPIYRVEELEDGGILILLDENPFNHGFLTKKVKEVSEYLLRTEF